MNLKMEQILTRFCTSRVNTKIDFEVSVENIEIETEDWRNMQIYVMTFILYKRITKLRSNILKLPQPYQSVMSIQTVDRFFATWRILGHSSPRNMSVLRTTTFLENFSTIKITKHEIFNRF